jgi:glycogen operon protein
MLTAGDEFLRTQGGNNNAYCQDNETSWVDWTLAEKNADFLRFARELIALRKRHPALRRPGFLRGRGPAGALRPDVVWHGLEPGRPDFSSGSRALAFTLDGGLTGREPDRDFYVAFNAWREGLPFRLPPAPSGRPWRRVVDTALAPPADIVGPDEGPLLPAGVVYPVASHSAVVLVSAGG